VSIGQAALRIRRAPMWATVGRIAQGENDAAGRVAGRANLRVARRCAPLLAGGKNHPVKWGIISASWYNKDYTPK